MTDTQNSRADACTATVTTDHDTPVRAGRVARALAPDNTASMTTRTDGATVETDIERDSTGGLQATVDDYVVNLGVAAAVLDALAATPTAGGDGTAADHDTADRGAADCDAAHDADYTPHS